MRKTTCMVHNVMSLYHMAYGKIIKNIVIWCNGMVYVYGIMPYGIIINKNDINEILFLL